MSFWNRHTVSWRFGQYSRRFSHHLVAWIYGVGLDGKPTILGCLNKHLNDINLNGGDFVRKSSIWIQCAFCRVLRTSPIDSSRKIRCISLFKSSLKTSYCVFRPQIDHGLKRKNKAEHSALYDIPALI